MSADFELTQDDLGTPIAAVLSDAGGAYPLTGCSVTFEMINRKDNSIVVNRLASPDPDQIAHPGRVVYNWISGDTSVAGDYLACFRVLINGITPVTFPSTDNKILVRIAPKLA